MHGHPYLLLALAGCCTPGKPTLCALTLESAPVTLHVRHLSCQKGRQSGTLRGIFVQHPLKQDLQLFVTIPSEPSDPRRVIVEDLLSEGWEGGRLERMLERQGLPRGVAYDSAGLREQRC